MLRLSRVPFRVRLSEGCPGRNGQLVILPALLLDHAHSEMDLDLEGRGGIDVTHGTFPSILSEEAEAMAEITPLGL